MAAAKELEIWSQVPAQFDAQTLGRSLKEVAVDYIETEDSNLQSRWFQSEKDADLFIWTDVNRKQMSNEVIKYQLSFFGQVVEWSIFDGVRTGVIVEKEITGEDPSEIIEFDALPQVRPLEQATKLLGFIGDLGEIEQQHLIEVLKQRRAQAPLLKPATSGRSSFQSLLKWMHIKK